MPFFNFRRGGTSSASAGGSSAQTESMEVIRKRAKHRLIGSAVLVLIGVVGFPLLFDTQPRPIPVDIPIEIPGKTAVKPLTVPATRPVTNTPASTSASGSVVATTPQPAPEKVADAASIGPREEIIPSTPVEARSDKSDKGDAKSDAKAVTKSVEAKAANTDEAARASALLNGADAKSAEKTAAASAAEGRVVVQVGAFADSGKAQDARMKLERAGLKTYTQVAETKDGKRIRVRVGPFATKAEAEKAAAKIKSLDLPTAILTL